MQFYERNFHILGRALQIQNLPRRKGQGNSENFFDSKSGFQS